VRRMLAEGAAAVPGRGMQAIPDQVAARLPAGSVRFGARVERLGHREVALPDGEVLRARAVVIATDGPSAARLTGGEVADPGSRGFITLYYAASQSPIAEPILLLDGDGKGPVNHAAVMSNLSPAYAPLGQSLIAA